MTKTGTEMGMGMGQGTGWLGFSRYITLLHICHVFHARTEQNRTEEEPKKQCIK